MSLNIEYGVLIVYSVLIIEYTVSLNIEYGVLIVYSVLIIEYTVSLI